MPSPNPFPAESDGTPSPEPERGTYIPSKPTDLRGPCPAVNCLANHGYIPRSGRNVHAGQLHSAMDEFGLSSVLASIFAYPPFIEVPVDKSSAAQAPNPPSSWWTTLLKPIAYILRGFAMRPAGQTDDSGAAYLNLDQLARHNVVEHDVSFSRLDAGQGDNLTPQPHLIRDILSASSNGSTLTGRDLVELRKRRYACQKEDNKEMVFGASQNQLASAEIALILKVLGNGKEVPVNYIKAFFEEERLPREEGWKKRSGWSVGFVEMDLLARKLKRMFGDVKGEEKPVVAAVL
ncbi:MAG: hypothetical protein Q9214_002628 [Letrouitia sp. 1 TL-2023]